MDSKMLVKMEPTFRHVFSETFSWCPALASSRHGDKDMNKREETLAQNLGLFRMLSTTDKRPRSPTCQGGFPGASAIDVSAGISSDSNMKVQNSLIKNLGRN